METGIELIAKERREQIEKHGMTIASDVNFNTSNQLGYAASAMCLPDGQGCGNVDAPENWDESLFDYMMNKSYKDRLIIAGALIAAEIDRLQNS